MADPVVGSIPFDDAITFLRDKTKLPTRTWTDLWQGMHGRAFVVAGAVKPQLVADFHNAITKAIEEGSTLQQFRKDFDKIVAEHGWTYNGSRGWRSAVIYNTNLRMAHSAGRWAQIQRVKTRRPFLRYSAVLDSRTRPEHRDWHDTVLTVDDEFWRTHTPPNGWNCRCTIQSLSQRDLDRRNLDVSKRPPIQPETRQINTPEGKQSITVPKGIDPGFAYNPGEAAFGRGASAQAQEKHGPFTLLQSPGGNRPSNPGRLTSVAADVDLGQRATTSTLRDRLRDAIGGDEMTFTDPTGARVTVGKALADHILEDPAKRLDGREAFFPLIPNLITDPAEIWVGFAASHITGRVLVRRRYVRLYDLGKDRSVGLIADLDAGHWSGFTFLRGSPRALNNLRTGLRVFKE